MKVNPCEFPRVVESFKFLLTLVHSQSLQSEDKFVMQSFLSKPTSPSSERNKDPILEVLRKIIPSTSRRLLEVGTGTGQHAVFFAQQFPNLEWVASDILDRHDGIQMWLQEAKLKNISGPLEFEIGKDEFPAGNFDYVYSANVLHIISWQKAQRLFELLGNHLEMGSELIFYGPFNYKGRFTSESNEAFDGWLKSHDPESGVRSFEEISEKLGSCGFDLVKDYEMPSNNRILHFRKCK